jgi:HSP20 family protein
VEANKARADFENGVLTVTMPIAEAVKPKAITIKAE